MPLTFAMEAHPPTDAPRQLHEHRHRAMNGSVLPASEQDRMGAFELKILKEWPPLSLRSLTTLLRGAG